VWNGVGDVSRRVSGVDTQVRLVHDRVSNVQARATHIQDMSNQLLQAVAQANQTLSQIVANPPAPAPAFKKSAVELVFEIATTRPQPVAGNSALDKANNASAAYCRGINYSSGKALMYIIDGSPTTGAVHVTRLFCYD
jgi:hypothetical protein